MMKTFLVFCLVATVGYADGPRLNRNPVGVKLPNNAPEDRGTPQQQLRYGLAMGRAYRCVGLQAQDFLNYGCFCGEGSTGVDTEPADAIDGHCRAHDLNLWAISENARYNNANGAACHCYTEVLPFSCQNGAIVMGANLTPCQTACEQDLIDMATHTQQAMASYHKEFSHRWQPFGESFRIPNYCQSVAHETPFSPYAPEEGVTAPAQEFWPVGRR